MSKRSENLYCCGGEFDTCDEPATWIRPTQFSGTHPFCNAHARKEKDFGESDSYKYWKKIPTNEVAPSKPKKVKLSDVIAEIEAKPELKDLQEIIGKLKKVTAL